MSSSPPRLSRPKADAQEIADIVEDARLGLFLIPDFQRPLKWQLQDRIDLFDSIFRGFPIGDLLFWEPVKLRPHARQQFGPFLPAHTHERPRYVVDGQQRLATILGCTLLPDRDPKDPIDEWAEWRLAFDCDTAKILPLRLNPGPQLLPLPVALDTNRYLEWTRALPPELRAERVRQGDDFAKALRQYKVPYYIVRTDDEASLRLVFERINNKGKTLDATDVFNALFGGANDPGMKELIAEIADTGFGRLDEELLVEAARLLVGGNPAREFVADLRQMDEREHRDGTPGAARERLKKHHEELRPVLLSTVDFLMDSGFRHISVVPHEMVISLLALYFHRFPGASVGPALATLRRWIWLLAAGGARTLHRSTYMRGAASDIRKSGSALGAAEALCKRSPVQLDQVADSCVFGNHRLRNNATKLVVLALFAQGPRELRSGAPIPVWSALDELGDRLFRPILDPRRSPRLGNNPANRCLDTSGLERPLLSARDAAAFLACAPDGDPRWASQCISPGARAALAAGEIGRFLDLRQAAIRSAVDQLIRSKLAEASSKS